MKKSDVIQWLFGELQQVLVDTTDTGITTTTEAEDHVDIADASIDHPYPSLVVQGIANNPQSAGIGGGHLYVDGKQFDNSGLLTAIDYRRESSLRVSIVAVTDSDPQLRDDLETAVADHFSLLARRGEFPDDITPEQIGESTPQDRANDLIRASGTPLQLEYERHFTDDNPDVAEEVNIDVDVSDSSNGEIDETDTDADAYNETF